MTSESRRSKILSFPTVKMLPRNNPRSGPKKRSAEMPHALAGAGKNIKNAVVDDDTENSIWLKFHESV
jgi:hypothetical protein